MEKKWFIGIDISKKTLDVVIYVPTKNMRTKQIMNAS